MRIQTPSFIYSSKSRVKRVNFGVKWSCVLNPVELSVLLSGKSCHLLQYQLFALHRFIEVLPYVEKTSEQWENSSEQDRLSSRFMKLTFYLLFLEWKEYVLFYKMFAIGTFFDPYVQHITRNFDQSRAYKEWYFWFEVLLLSDGFDTLSLNSISIGLWSA